MKGHCSIFQYGVTTGRTLCTCFYVSLNWGLLKILLCVNMKEANEEQFQEEMRQKSVEVVITHEISEREG